jgi:drug/metabolite transporter (DMT)-like permease
VLSLVAAPLLEAPRLEPTATATALIVALGVTGALTFYLQLRAQAVVDPSVAALIFTLEPVFAALASYLVLGERLGPVQWAGGALILAATALPALEVRRTPAGRSAP